MSKSTLGKVLEQIAQRPPVIPVRAPLEPPAAAATSKRTPARQGKMQIAGFFEPAVKSSILLIQVQRPGVTTQDLLDEALNDLFAKYNVPQVAGSKARNDA